VVALESSPTNLDPRLALDAVSERINQLIYSKLVRFDERLNIVPDLAESWENPDPRTYIFHLKKNALFHDGAEVTSRDVKYTFESIIDPALGSAKRGSYSSLDRIDTPDPWTVVFKLKEPYAPFMVSMVQGIVPVSSAGSGGKSLSSKPVGSGPFRFADWKQGDRIELIANENYYGGLPKMERVVFRIIPDETTRFLEIEKGGVHFIQNGLSPDMLPRLKENENLKLLTGPGTNYSYLGFNLEDPILKNKKVRQAIASAIDREKIIDNILRGTASPATGLLPPQHWAYEGQVARYPYDPSRAARLLDEAGFRDPDGDGPETRFKLIYKTSQNQLKRRIAEVIQRDLKKIGIGVEIRSYEWGTFFSHIRSGNFQIYSLTWVGITEPDIYYYIFHSDNIPPQGANRGRYRNSQLDRLLERGRRTLSREERKAIYGQVQKIIAADVPYVSLWHETNVAVMRADVEGFRLYPGGDFTSMVDVSFKKR
jgi:peptide/nickel transport system substrate-binding protein